jgi:murein DD-endopeptidase MepM/ murein hydrolase activator NlpD
MKRLLFILLLLAIVPFLLPDKEQEATHPVNAEAVTEPVEESTSHTITGIVQSRETLDSIFGKHKLNKADLNKIYFTSKKQFNLSRISVGSVYSFELDNDKNEIQKMQFGIDDSSFLNVLRSPEGFTSEKVDIQYDTKIGSFYIDIQGNLTSSMPGTHKEYNRLALNLSDIYAWDIDFSNDIRNGDSVKIIVEELWAGGAFKGYGDILAAEFYSGGKVHKAYRFEENGYSDYYDENGKSLRKALLRSPLKFKYISSRFTKSRLHPELRIYRPHLGVDYAAPTGTPVSAAGSGKIVYAGRKGQMGKMVRIKHPGGYETYYGHLSRIPRKIRRGTKVSQGDLIGYVGSTGLSTGPHLDYRIKFNGRFVNPLTIKLPKGTSIPKNVMAKFNKIVDGFAPGLASLIRPVIALTDKKKKTSGS